MGFWNALASAFGSMQQNRNIDKQLKAQANENALNRSYNLQLAQMQNHWNQAQWNLENAYNSPSAQMERMRQAGLNPDMIYGGGVSGNLSASSPTMTSGAPSSPMDWSALSSKKSLGQVALEAAQLDNIQAQTDKVKAETVGQHYTNEALASDAKYRDAINEGEIAVKYATIRGIDSNIAKDNQDMAESRQRTVNLQKECENIVLKGKEIRASISNLDAATASRKLEDALRTAEVQAAIKKFAAEEKLTLAEAEAISKKCVWEIAGLQSSIEVNDARLRNINFSTDQISFDLGQAKEWSDFEHRLGFFTKACNGLSMVTGSIGLVLGGKSPKPIKGFRN